ncbi:unnamed protein product, partial [Musa hybrid cultivar]
CTVHSQHAFSLPALLTYISSFVQPKSIYLFIEIARSSGGFFNKILFLNGEEITRSKQMKISILLSLD